MKQADIEKLGKYQVTGELGRGAMGVVYKGFDPGIERNVAIKTVRKDMMVADDADATRTQVERFKREAQAAGRMTHPNIVAIYEYGEDGDTAFIAMEFIEGRSLKEFFDEHERFDVKDIVRIMSDLLSALEYSHRNGIVHRDIKPANIMITKAGEVKITDFGIARIESSSLTQAGAVLGTPSYMSPEQFMGQRVDARSDLFSAGTVLYQFLTAEKPFTGSLTTIMHKILNSHPEPPSVLNVAVPKPFDAVVAKAMAKRPDERFQSAAEFIQALKNAMTGQAPAAPAAPDVEATATDRTMLDSGALAHGAGPSEAEPPVRLGSDARPRAAASPQPPAEPPAKGGGKGLAVAAGVAGVAVIAGGAGWWLLVGSKPAEPVVSPPIHAGPSPTEPATPSAAEQAEARRQAEAARRRTEEAERQAAAQRQSEAQRQADEAKRRAEDAERQAAAQRQSEAQRQADEAKRRAEDAERQAAAQRQSEAQRQADEAKRRAEDAERQAAAQRQAEAQRQADEAKRQAEAQRTAEAARTRLAAAGAALGQVKSALDRIDCSLLQAAMVDSGGFTVSGLAGPAASAPAIRRTIDEIAPGTPVEVAVEPVTQAMCDPLGAISQARTANAAVPKAVVVQTSSADAVYKNGQNLMLDVVAPDQTSYLQVDYFTLEGYVVHLFPNGLEKDNRLAAGKKRTLGNPAAGGRFWTIGPPFGRELIVAIATPKPLFPSLRPEAELASTYLQELKKALASAGGQASPPLASALFIKTVPN